MERQHVGQVRGKSTPRGDTSPRPPSALWKTAGRKVPWHPGGKEAVKHEDTVPSPCDISW